MPMQFPPDPQLLNHARGDGNVAILAPFSIADMKPLVFEIRNLDADRFTDPEAAVINQAKRDAKAFFLQSPQDFRHFLTAQNNGQSFGPTDDQFGENLPIGFPKLLHKETVEGGFDDGHAGAGEFFVLAQEQEITPDLIFGQVRRITPVML